MKKKKKAPKLPKNCKIHLQIGYDRRKGPNFRQFQKFLNCIIIQLHYLLGTQLPIKKIKNRTTCQEWDSNPCPFGPVPETGALDQLGHLDFVDVLDIKGFYN